MDKLEAWRTRFEEAGEATVRARVRMDHHSPYNQEHRAAALVWLDEIDRAREQEAAARRDTAQAEQMELSRRATVAAEQAALSAQDANKHAQVANLISWIAAALAGLAFLLSIWSAYSEHGP